MELDPETERKEPEVKRSITSGFREAIMIELIFVEQARPLTP